MILDLITERSSNHKAFGNVNALQSQAVTVLAASHNTSSHVSLDQWKSGHFKVEFILKKVYLEPTSMPS